MKVNIGIYERLVYLNLKVISNFYCGWFLWIKPMSFGSWSVQAPTLVGPNYDFWSEKVKYILQGQGCWDCVEIGFTEPDSNIIAIMSEPETN